LRLSRNRIAKRFHAPRDRILVVIGRDRLHRLLFYVLRRGKIRKSLTEIHSIVLHRLAGHFADHGLGKARSFGRNAAFLSSCLGSHKSVSSPHLGGLDLVPRNYIRRSALSKRRPSAL